MDLQKRLVYNSASNGIRLAVTVGIGIFVPPFMIVRLGIAEYGVWALLMATSNLIYMFDLGLQPALMKLIAESHVAKDGVQLKRDLNTVLAVNLVSSALALLVGWFGAPLLVSVYFHSMSQIPFVKELIVLFISVSAVGMISDTLLTVLSGFQRMDEANIISVFALVLQTTVLVILLSLKMRLWGIASSMVLGYCLKLGLAWIRLRYYMSDCQVGGFQRPGWMELRRLLYLSSSGVAIRIGGTITGQLNKFLIGYLAEVSWVAYYDLASRIINQLGGVSSIMFAPLIPSVSRMSALGETDRIGRLTDRSLVYMNLLVLPFFWFLLIFAKGLITAWLGPGFSVVALTLQILIVAHYINHLSGPAFHTLVGLGKPALGTWAVVINSVLFCLGAVLGGALFGYWGIVSGEFIGVASGGLFLTMTFYRTQRLSFWRMLLRTVLIPSCLILAGALGLMVVRRTFSLTRLDHSLWFWGVEFCMYWLVGMGLLRVVGILGPYELSLVRVAFLRRSPSAS